MSLEIKVNIQESNDWDKKIEALSNSIKNKQEALKIEKTKLESRIKTIQFINSLLFEIDINDSLKIEDEEAFVLTQDFISEIQVLQSKTIDKLINNL